jgi:hypothetical protein
MGFVCEIALCGDPAIGAAARAWFACGPATAWAQVPGLVALDVYVPAEGEARDPYNRDAHGPLQLIMLDFASVAPLAAAMAADLPAALAQLPSGLSATATALERRFYPVAGESEAGALRAPFSYVVRYDRPAEDEAAFVANYIASHPTTQADLPGIRSVICYLPLDRLNGTSLPAAPYMIGNEVVFDNIADFNVAMASPVREELRAHFRQFPPFSGAVTHHPMTRTRLYG